MKRRKLLVCAVAALAAVGGAGAAVAAGVSLPFSDDGSTINGCYSPGGALKVLTPTRSSCPDGYTAIHWNVTGPAGPQGPIGSAGPQGPPGTSGKSHVYYGTGSIEVKTATEPGDRVVATPADAPSGRYLVMSTLASTYVSGQSDEGDADCVLLKNGSVPVSTATGDDSSTAPNLAFFHGMTLSAVTILNGGDTLAVYCTKGRADTPVLVYGNIIAMPVDQVN